MTDNMKHDPFAAFLQEQGIEVAPIEDEIQITDEAPATEPVDLSPVIDPRTDLDVLEASSIRTAGIISQLPDPMETHIWDYDLTDFQSQLRGCLANEIIDRFVQAGHQTYDLFDSGMEEDMVRFALMFPITIAFIIHNAKLERTIERFEEDVEIPADSFGDMTVAELIDGQENKYTCEMIHGTVAKIMNSIPAHKAWETLPETQIADCLCAGHTVTKHFYMTMLKGYFKQNLKIRQIVSMSSNVIAVATRVVKAMETAFDED